MPGAYWFAPCCRAATASAITSGGPSTSGNPWPRLSDPVRTASADISLKMVGGMPCSRVASRVAMRTSLPVVTTTDDSLAADIDACCRLTGEFTLRSGQVATEYFDKYLFEADPLLLARVAREM